MCKCTPEIRTPYCGKGDCVWPKRKQMILHGSAYGYLKPTDDQLKTMENLRTCAANYSNMLELYLPNGPDKTFIIRSLRTVAMWVNVCVTREDDGSPRV